MARTLLISITASFVIVGAWTANLVCYHPQPTNDGLNPLAPISMTTDWR